ncbi:MAG TPA: permease prefix domain 1-containing protein [Kofleriaceae bacterium]
MEIDMTQVDDVIERYKAELLDEAELARDDLQEIEAHLRALTEELLERGTPAVEAVHTACERLGDPRAVAREHAKVHSPFGARLSWGRTISASALLLALLLRNYAFFQTKWDKIPAPFSPLAMTILATVMVAALLARLTWARPVVLGGMGFMTTYAIVAGTVPVNTGTVWLVALIGTVVFVMPWRRHELRRTGYTLVLLAFACSATGLAAGMLGLDSDALAYAREHGIQPNIVMPIRMVPAALIGFVPLVVAIGGTILRARWAAVASAFGAAMLLVSLIEVVRYYIGFHELEDTAEWLPLASMLTAGSIAASVAALTSWKSARSNTGTLQYVLR